MEAKIAESKTIEELSTLEGLDVLSRCEHALVFERKVEIMCCTFEWERENKQLGMVADLSDSWTPERQERFLCESKNDKPFEIDQGQKRSYEEMNDAETLVDDEPLLQAGRGKKRSIDEVNVGAETYVKQIEVKKFNTTGLDYTVQFADTFADLELSEFHDRLHEIFESLLNAVTKDIPAHDQVRFVLRSPQLENPISLPFMPLSRLTTERVLDEIERVIQSNREFRLNDRVQVNLIHVAMPNGGTSTKRSEINLEKHLAKKGSIIRIQNKDEICLARALVVSIAKIENDNRYRCIADQRKPLQARLACDLHEKANVCIGPCGLVEVKQFQTYLTEYQINIVSKDHQNSIIYSGPEKEKRIYLFLHDNHYDVITSMPAFFARKRYCHTCNKPYDHTGDHICPDLCKLCYFQSCPVDSWVPCTDCNRFFKSQECFARHKQNIGQGKSLCASFAKCGQCHNVVRRGQLRPDLHHCEQTKCSTCSQYVDTKDHLFYMQPVKERPVGETQSNLVDDETCDGDDSYESGYNELLFFDFECRQENGTHEPNLCVVHNEAGDEWVFQGDNTRNDFCEWLFTKEHANCIVVAHNFQGYDGYFIQQYLRENGIVPEVIMRGAKILTLSVPMFKIKFIDSLSFMPMRLADFPKTFGIDELAKGYFPHLFNKKENETYVGPIPPGPYYNPNGMSPNERETFLEWHNGLKENNYIFNFQKEILTYCRSDVDILRRCCLQFRELFRDVTDIDPFEQCLTIASACNLVFRTNLLKENTIAIVPPHGYHPKTKQSNMALKWLSFIAEKDDIYIRHKRNGGEESVGSYFLDGYHEETNTAYEFHGCFWHGKFCLNSYLPQIIVTNTKSFWIFFLVIFYRMLKVLCTNYGEYGV